MSGRTLEDEELWKCENIRQVSLGRYLSMSLIFISTLMYARRHTRGRIPFLCETLEYLLLPRDQP